MIMCDLLDVDTGELVEVAPRTVLRRQVEAAAALGFLPMVASEIEFYLFHDTYDEAHAKGYRDLRPHSPWLEDYHILQTTKDEYVLGAIRRGLEAAGVPVEFSKGEAGRGQHEINLDYTDGGRDGRPQQRLQDGGEGDRPPATVARSASWPSTTSTTPARRATSTPACGRSTARQRAVRRPPRPARHERDVPATTSPG